MDPVTAFGLAAGALQFLQYAFDMTRDTYLAMKDAKRDVLCLTAATSALSAVFATLGRKDPDTGVWQIAFPSLKTAEMERLFTSMEKELNALGTQLSGLEPLRDEHQLRNKLRSILPRLKWALRADEAKRVLNQIRTYQEILVFAATAETLALTDEAVVLLERLQQQHIQIIGRLDDLARAQVHLVAAQGDVEAVSQEIRIGVKNIITHEEQALQNEAMTWLYPGDPKAYHNKIVRERAPVTGSWFLESEAFLAWCKDKPNGSGARILLGRAIPGAGKTFLASSVIDHLGNRSSTVAYYYYRFESERAPYNQICWVHRALISQIARQLGNDADLQTLYKGNRGNDANSLGQDVWQELLLTLCRRSTPIYFVFDGLDVPSDQDREDLVRFLADFSPSGLRILVTSRPMFTALTATIDNCCILDLRAPAEGLANFVESLLERKPSLPPGLLRKGYDRKRLAQIIANATSSSMLLVAKGHVEGIFRTPRNPPAYLKRITALESRSIERTVGEGEDSTAVPKAVQEVYNRMLALIRESRRDDVISALAWLVELGGSADADLIRRAAYIEPDMTAPDEDLQDSAEGLVDASFGFVTLEDSSQGQQQFRLAHETCRDYFRSYADTSKWPTMLAQTSLTYLSFERSMSLWTGPPGLPWRTAEDSLFDAACEFLLSDMEGVDGSQTRNALERLLYSSGPNLGDFIFMVAQVIQRRRCNERQDLMQELLINLEVAVEPGNVLFFSLELLIASCIGLTSDVRSVVRGSISHLGWNMALMLCAFFGRESFAIELFKIWPYISPGPVIDYSRTVLHFTALAPPDSYLRIKATKLLIDHGIQMPHGAPGGGTLLHLISPDVPFAGLLNGCGTPYGTVVDKQHTVVHKKPHEDMQSVARLVIERGPLLENALELERETLPRWIHFNQIGDMELLGEALYLDREALRLRPEGHPERALSCENLAVLLRTRFNQTGDTWLMDKVLELQREALALHPVGHPERALSCGNLAISLRTLFNQDGDTLLLDEALELQREALTLQPVGHPERAVSCGNLASSLKTCFDHAGDTALLDKALELEREALALQPEGHPEHGLSCGNLASSLWTRFNHTRDTSLLDETFGLDREALRLHPQGHPERAVSCENLAVSLWTRFNQTGDPTLLDEILELQREALALRPAGHPDRAESCTNLANSLRTRFEQTGDTALLDDALELDREVLRRDPARALLCANLVISLEARFNQTGEVRFLNEAESLCSRAIKDHALSPSDHVLLRVQLVRIYTSPAYPSSSLSTAVRFLSEAVVHRIGLITHFYAVNVALLLCVRAAVSDEENVRLLAVYEVIIEVLPEIGGASLDKVWRLCGRCDEADIPTQALIQAVKANDVPSGLILWEQGRAVRWSHILAMRDPQYEGLTHEWKTRLQTLLKSTSFLAEHGKTQQLSLTTCDREPEFYSRLQLLLEEIRASPGLLRFMRGLSYSELAQVSSMHPVIVLFTDGKACHTLVLSSASDSPAHLVLPHIPPFVLSVVGHDIRNPAAAPDPVRSVRPFGRRFEDRFRGALGRLWACTVKPLLDHLGLQKASGRNRRRLHWCPIGTLASVPFHAAGVNFGENTVECCSDYVVSSYTPTLSALCRARTSLAPVPRRSLVLLAAGNPQGPEQSFMPGVLAEITAVARTARAADHMEVLEYGLISGAKVHEVTDALSRAHIVHLAGHMHTENQHHSKPHPLDLGFFLADGKLTVSEIMDVELRHAFLLFLSSCDTAKGDESQPDQAVHLAAAMLFSGFRNVIATMWSMCDDDGPKVACAFYEALLSAEIIDADAVVYALDTAVLRLREKEVSPSRWGMFVHVGA